jgi:hypothetical protein
MSLSTSTRTPLGAVNEARSAERAQRYGNLNSERQE